MTPLFVIFQPSRYGEEAKAMQEEKEQSRRSVKRFITGLLVVGAAFLFYGHLCHNKDAQRYAATQAIAQATFGDGHTYKVLQTSPVYVFEDEQDGTRIDASEIAIILHPRDYRLVVVGDKHVQLEVDRSPYPYGQGNWVSYIEPKDFLRPIRTEEYMHG